MYMGKQTDQSACQTETHGRHKRSRDKARQSLVLNLLDVGRPGANIKIEVEDMGKY